MNTQEEPVRSPTGHGVYLYCCARADLLPPTFEVEGLEAGKTVRQLRLGDLVAVTSEVPLEEFTGSDAEERLKDIGWLAPRALRHEQVIEEVAHRSPVFPVRFGTIFSSREALEALLTRHHDALRAFLDRTTDAEEWGFKGYLDRKKAQERLVDEELATHREQLSASPGLRYMQERRARAQAEERLGSWLRETSSRLKQELSHRALDAAERKLLPPGATEHPGEMVLNWAFLVPKAGVAAFRALVEELSRELGGWGLAFEVVGPFPPYSFTPGLGEQGP